MPIIYKLVNAEDYNKLIEGNVASGEMRAVDLSNTYSNILSQAVADSAADAILPIMDNICISQCDSISLANEISGDFAATQGNVVLAIPPSQSCVMNNSITDLARYINDNLSTERVSKSIERVDSDIMLSCAECYCECIDETEAWSQGRSAAGICQSTPAVDERIDDGCVEEICKRKSVGACTKLSGQATLMRESMPVTSLPSVLSHARIERQLGDLIGKAEMTFSQMLLKMIDDHGLSDIEVYKRANIDRKHFSKIRSNADYKPSKTTAVAFCIAMELSEDDTKDLLLRAGYALSRSNKFDLIIHYFVSKAIYDMQEVNMALCLFGQPLLGSIS